MQMDSLLFAVHSMGKFVGWYGSTRFTVSEFHQQWVSAGDGRPVHSPLSSVIPDGRDG